MEKDILSPINHNEMETQGAGSVHKRLEGESHRPVCELPDASGCLDIKCCEGWSLVLPGQAVLMI